MVTGVTGKEPRTLKHGDTGEACQMNNLVVLLNVFCYAM